MDVELEHVKIHLIAVTYGKPGTQPFNGPQKYMLDLNGCVITSTNPYRCQPFPQPGGLHLMIDNGMFVPTMDTNAGQMFAPGGDPNLLGPGVGIGSILKIHWCPTEDYFLVNLNGQMLDPLKKAQTSVFATVSPLADASGPARGSVCYPIGDFQCGTTSRPSSGLECKCFTILVRGVPEEICTCEPTSSYLDTVCNKDFVGTCGSLDSSGLTCQCKIFCPGCQETCTCKPELMSSDVCTPGFIEDCTRTGGKVAFEVFGAKVTCICEHA